MDGVLKFSNDGVYMVEKLLTWEKTSKNTWLSKVFDRESYNKRWTIVYYKRWKIVYHKRDNTISVYEYDYDVSKGTLYKVKSKECVDTIDEALLWVDERLSRTQQIVSNRRINDSYQKQIQSIDERLLKSQLYT